MTPDPARIDWLTLAMGAIGGLGLFLYGVDLLATGLKQSGGGRFHRLLDRLVPERAGRDAPIDGSRRQSI